MKGDSKVFEVKLSDKVTVLIVLCHNGMCVDIIESIIESGELNYEPNKLIISYFMNVKEKNNSPFITNDGHA